MDRITDYKDYNKIPFLLSYFYDSNLVKILEAGDSQLNALETVYWDIYLQMFLVTAEGAQLDLAGIELGLARDGKTDVDYRLLLRMKSAMNVSAGNPETIITLLRDFLGCTDIALSFLYPAKIRIRQESPLVESDLRKYLLPVVPAGVGLGIDVYLLDNNGNNIVTDTGDTIIGICW